MQVCADVLFQRLVVFCSALGTTYAVDVEFEALESHFSQEGRGKRNDFSVCARTVRTVTFHAELMVLSESAVLRFFIAENACDIVRFHRHNALMQAVFDKTARNACRAFGAQSHTSAALVVKSVHFLRHDVRRFANAPQKEFGVLEHRRANLFESETSRNFSCDVLDVVPLVCLLRKHIFSSLGYVYHIASMLFRFIY